MDVLNKAMKMDAVITADLRSYEAAFKASELDRIIEVGSPIQRYEIEQMDIITLYTIDMELVHRKIRPLKTRERREMLKSVIVHYAQKYGVDPNLCKAVAKAESHFNPTAKSHKNAYGIMQLIMATANDYGVRDVNNPVDNIQGGVRYLAHLMKKYNGNKKLTLAAYNAGPRKVKRYRGIPPFPETQDYVKKVLKYYREYQKTEPIANT
jgi:soluble lytic murein transglycosylase-like protein